MEGHSAATINGLPKAERLCGKTTIGNLAAHGHWMTTEHLKCCWKKSESEVSRILVSVPKRHFKRAVKRNLLKRRLREAYRLQKGLLKTPVDFMLYYNCTEIQDFAPLMEEVASVLEEISRRTSA